VPVIGLAGIEHSFKEKIMFSLILTKFGVPLLLVAAGTVAGIGIQQKILNAKPTECPACICPKCPELPTLAMQPFDMQKMKRVKEFNYSPAFTGSITVAGVDSVSIRKYINEAVAEAFEKNIVPTTTKKKRR
jgi:hypothetical protein